MRRDEVVHKFFALGVVENYYLDAAGFLLEKGVLVSTSRPVNSFLRSAYKVGFTAEKGLVLADDNARDIVEKTGAGTWQRRLLLLDTNNERFIMNRRTHVARGQGLNETIRVPS